MNKPVRKILYLMIAAFLGLLVNLTYLQVFAADKITSHRANTRSILKELTIPRGRIYSSDGVLLAKNKKEGKNYFRIYPKDKLFAHIIGFNSVRYGRSGLELTFNDHLLGKKDTSSFTDFVNQVKEKGERGNDLVLTINYDLQKKAYEALGDRQGSIVAINPETGEILAMVSKPSYNPNTIKKQWKNLNQDSSSPLVNRATQGLYPPGSVFKIVTTEAALAEGIATASSVYDGPKALKVYGGKVTNYKDQGYGRMSLAKAFAVSCNTIFAQVGLEIGGRKFVEFAEELGFNHPLPLEILTKKSTIPSPYEIDKLELAWSAVGQGRISTTPLQIALATSAAANQGVIMKSHLVKEVKNRRGEIVKQYGTETWRKVIPSNTAETLTDLMIDVVEEGTGKRARIPGVKIGGKTGTAEVSKEKDTHAWFAAVAPADDPQIVVVVIVEHGGIGGRTAAPIAKTVIEEWLRINGSN